MLRLPAEVYPAPSTVRALVSQRRSGVIKLANHPDSNELGDRGSASCSTSVAYSALSASASPVSPLRSPFSLGPSVPIRLRFPPPCTYSSGASFSSLMYSSHSGKSSETSSGCPISRATFPLPAFSRPSFQILTNAGVRLGLYVWLNSTASATRPVRTRRSIQPSTSAHIHSAENATLLAPAVTACSASFFNPVVLLELEYRRRRDPRSLA